jgi:uncharacterized coiled-coil protein SlyX
MIDSEAEKTAGWAELRDAVSSLRTRVVQQQQQLSQVAEEMRDVGKALDELQQRIEAPPSTG